MRVLVNAALLCALLVSVAQAGVVPEGHPVAGLPWLVEQLSTPAPARDDAEGALVGRAELGVLLAHGELSASRLRLAELEARFPDADWSEPKARLASLGGTYVAPTIQWISEPRTPGESDLLLVLLWSDSAPSGAGRDPVAVRELHQRYSDAGLRVHGLVREGENAPRAALRLLGALNLPVGVGVGSPEAWTTWGAGRATIGLLVKDGVVLWRGYPSQLDPGTVGSVLRGDHRATSKKRPETAWKTLADAGLGCTVSQLQPALRTTGLPSEGDAAGALSSLLAEGCGKRRLLVRLNEQSWLSEQVRFDRSAP